MNPFKELREAKGWDITTLSEQSLIDRKALSRAEDGMYANPLPSLVDFWVKNGPMTYTEILANYEDFQTTQRKTHTWYFGRNLHFQITNAEHPLRQLRRRRAVELTQFCRDLCLPLDTIQFFEKKWRTYQSVPKSLQEVLNINGYTRHEITVFCNDYRTWRNKHGKVTFK
jgi:hypothetical protein